ncbi:interferon lambda-4-like [Sminthopsis crassicaudata]|uniref:interferon lambda-4-like n=1 Tax=Sminthopsis crassicaudata TaxID=9301 RepID=UPI003D68466F
MPSGLSFPISFMLALWVLRGSGDPGVRRPRRCSLGHYYSLNPEAVTVVKTFSNLYAKGNPESHGETLGHGGGEGALGGCSRDIPPSGVCLPQPCARLRQVALALAAAESVVRNLRLPALAASAGPVLELLWAVRSDVLACVSPPSLGSPSQSSAGPDSADGGARAGRSREAARLAEPRLAENHPLTQPGTRASESARPGRGGGAQPRDFDTQGHGKLDRVDRGSKKKRRTHKAASSESPRCREAETVLGLLKLLTSDLKKAILAGPCASA